VKLGMFMMPLHPPEKPPTVSFEEDIELVVRADELAFTEAWIGQHHSIAWEPIPANDLFIANVLPRTRNIRLGTGVTLVPHHHPVNIAQRLAFLDHLARGRFNCGFGQGGVPTDAELFGLPDPMTQGLMTLEGIDLVLKLWQAEPPFDFKGRFWHVKIEHPDPAIGLGTTLKPYQKPHPPVAMTMVKGSSRAAGTAGQRGFIPLSTNLAPIETVAAHWRGYAAGAADAGRTPDRALWRVSRSILVADSSRQAWEHARSGTLARGFDYLTKLLKKAGSLDVMKHAPDVADSDVTWEYCLRHLCIIGDVEECRRQLREVWDRTGGFGTLLMIAHDWDDRARWLRSAELLAREVVPALPSI
jgi:alkanesulfonate monooxygenase SsuD/methylene tetrahydromethanopterin reductase-like flavin-dependent oxidoreductase (luciferase family)